MRWPLSVSRILLIFTVLFVLVVSVIVVDCLADAEEAGLAVERAEGVVVSAYRVVLEAEGAGANVSGLLVRLNRAGELLAQASVSYRAGDFDGAVRFADLCSEIGEGVSSEAEALKNLAVVQGDQRFRWTIITSFLGVAIIVCATFMGWHIFKLRYYRRVSEMKPEVAPGET